MLLINVLFVNPGIAPGAGDAGTTPPVGGSNFELEDGSLFELEDGSIRELEG